MHILNVYAPAADKEPREAFFSDLHSWRPRSVGNLILAGDFNCVESPVLDRRGGSRSEKTESESLTRLVQQSALVDARVQLGSALDELELSPHEHFTFWRGEVASRIDRFYIPQRMTQWLQWLQVQLPPVPSDHDEVTLHLRDPASTRDKPATRRAPYPINGARSERLIEELLRELNGKAPQRGAGYLSWDAWITQCRNSIKQIARREKKRRQRKSNRLQRQLRENATSRTQLLTALVQDLRDRSAARFGIRLERTPAEIRWLFKRTAVWERDQTVSTIHAPTGENFDDSLPIPERFSQVWARIMGRRHSQLSPPDMKAALQKFATVPDVRRVRVEDNKRLLAPISEDDLLAAVADLQRFKAGGEDGLNNDFYLDLAATMIPRLVTVCNDLLEGRPPPPSFLKAVVVPLRKKGDSPNALDYRPISLLQTSYKLFAKVLATRLQSFLGRLIGDTQQGFVHGRQMDRSVVMMLAHLEQAIYDAFISASDSAGILLLDFAKAYDTVDRAFLLEVLRQFGFAPEFVDLMARLHEGTTAQFFVNGQYSSPLQVKSGIRQGCPLAPLLFILAAEFLALALQQDEQLRGLQVSKNQRCREHKFSAFVDDSTVFLKQSSQLPRVMKLVEHFGQISGLKVQPVKSKYIFLNKAILAGHWCGIPVLPVGDTVRYLGYDVGFSDLSKVNWAKRIRSIHRRMATAEQAATTVRDRVDLFNAIVLPAVLFTAKMFPPTKEVLTSLVNMQKQFVWRRQLKDDPSRHKFTPSLIFTPKQAGGLGLISVPVAIQAQRVKMSMLWLISRHDVYREAWFTWMCFQGDEPAVSPRKESKSRWQSTVGSRRRLFQKEVCAALAPTEAEQNERQELSARYVPRLAAAAGQLSRSATYQPRSREKITINVDLCGLPSHRLEIPELTAFWGTFAWADNPWIPDSTAPVLPRTKYDRIAVTSIVSLEIIRTHRSTYSVRVPTAPGYQVGHTIAKLERWLIAILLHSPRIEVGEQLGQAPPLLLRKPPRLTQRYIWSAEADSIVVGISDTGQSTITLQQQGNGLNWDVISQHNAKKDVKKLAKHPEGIVFQANPRIHGFPWQVPARTRNRNIMKALKMQPKKQLRVQACPDLDKVLKVWEARGEQDDWIRGLQSQQPQQLWAHRNTLTNYQVWVAYRMAAQQLNLHYQGELLTDGCLLAQDAKEDKVTITHITWGCERAQQFWSRCVEHWLGHEVSSSRLEAYKSYISSRGAPPISGRMRRVLMECYGNWNKDYEDALRRIWWSMCSIGYALLWQIRNQVVHEGTKWRARQQLEYMWASCLRQISAVARNERNKPATRTNGLRLQLTLDCYVAITIEAEPPDSPPAPAAWLNKKESALIKRLRKFQEAIN